MVGGIKKNGKTKGPMRLAGVKAKNKATKTNGTKKATTKNKTINPLNKQVDRYLHRILGKAIKDNPFST